MKKTYRIKTNNQEQLQRKQNESDATSKWIEFQKTRPRRRIQDKDVPVIIKHELSRVYQRFIFLKTWNRMPVLLCKLFLRASH